MTIDKGVLGIAGEFAVAAELCRRNVYAQLTLGNRKRTDLLILSSDDRFARVEVKSKQGSVWPNLRGIVGADVFLVLVDFKEGDDERPEFYVLTEADWKAVVGRALEIYRQRHPTRRAMIDCQNCLVTLDEVDKAGKPWRGTNVSPAQVAEYRDAWWKITAR